MNSLRSVSMLTCSFLVFGTSFARADEGAILQALPAELPIQIVVRDFEALQKAIGQVTRTLDPQGQPPTILADVKRQIAIGDWIDFSKPFAMAQTNFTDEDNGLFCGVVSDFATKAKDFDGASESNGVWKFPISAGEEPTYFYAMQKGPFVLGSKMESVLKLATGSEKSLADAMQSRGKALAGRNVTVHFDMKGLRSTVMAGMGQLAQMAPMMAMMAGQQMGSPEALGSMVGVCVEAITKFAEQVDYIDLGIDVDTEAISATVASGFGEGTIRTYLAKQKPASMKFFTEISAQPYFALIGFHVPGDESPFLDYAIKKMMAAVPAPAPPAEADATGESAPEGDTPTPPATEELLKTSLEFYRFVQGVNAVIAFTPEGVKESGDCLTHSPGEMLKLAKKMIASYSPMMQQFGLAGTTFEALGTKDVAGTSVTSYALKIDPNDPAAAQMAGMYGENTILAFGETNGRVRFHLGREQDLPKTFAPKKESPIAASNHVKAALASLPADRNVVALIDPVGLLPVLGAMMGAPAAEVPPGPPIALSVSLSGGPGRLDIRVPIRSIERIKQAFAPDEPM